MGNCTRDHSMLSFSPFIKSKKQKVSCLSPHPTATTLWQHMTLAHSNSHPAAHAHAWGHAICLLQQRLLFLVCSSTSFIFRPSAFSNPWLKPQHIHHPQGTVTIHHNSLHSASSSSNLASLHQSASAHTYLQTGFSSRTLPCSMLFCCIMYSIPKHEQMLCLHEPKLKKAQAVAKPQHDAVLLRDMLLRAAPAQAFALLSLQYPKTCCSGELCAQCSTSLPHYPRGHVPEGTTCPALGCTSSPIPQETCT